MSDYMPAQQDCMPITDEQSVQLYDAHFEASVANQETALRRLGSVALGLGGVAAVTTLHAFMEFMSPGYHAWAGAHLQPQFEGAIRITQLLSFAGYSAVWRAANGARERLDQFKQSFSPSQGKI